MTVDRITQFVDAYLERLQAVIEQLPRERMEAIGEMLYQAYRHNKQVFIVGNGGSASTASHMACDLGQNTIGAKRPRFRIMGLTTTWPSSLLLRMTVATSASSKNNP